MNQPEKLSSINTPDPLIKRGSFDPRNSAAEMKLNGHVLATTVITQQIGQQV